MVNCPKCSTPLIDGARFCGVCGHRLDEAKPAGKGIVKAPPGAPTLAPDGSRSVASAGSPPPAKPRGKLAGMPREVAAPAAADPLPSYLEGDPYLGKNLNERFEVLTKLGEGGFGAVYRGKQVGTGREVALKLLHPEMTRDKNVLARFRREGEVLCQLRDAHTITTYDFDQTRDGTLFIAMELLSGHSLHHVFETESPIAWDRMMRIVAQMCSSLHEAHSLGIVHRDLKPENIYLESRPGHPEYVKILDFGIAKVVRGDGEQTGKPVAQLTATGQTLGTLEYMSPEQLMGKPLDGRSDVYAVGVLCYEMMTGQLPFPDAIGPAAQIAAQLKQTPVAPSKIRPEMNIPAAVDDIILRCLGKRPDDRYPDIATLQTAVDELLERHDRGDALTPVNPTSPPGRELPRAQPPAAEAAPRVQAAPVRTDLVSREDRGVPLWLIAIAVAVVLGAGTYALLLLRS